MLAWARALMHFIELLRRECSPEIWRKGLV